MRCPTLNELPPPPISKTGWPWTAESTTLSQSVGENHLWPKISIVTPSFNQGAFLEATIRSVLLQGYPNLEYVIIDGGSTDGSVEIIQKYEPWLTYWVSENDRGQYDAINKGFSYTSGHVMAWLNSDDMYVLNSFKNVGEIFLDLGQQVQWITGIPSLWNQQGFTFSILKIPRYMRAMIRLGFYDERGLPSIQQESSFWSRKLWRLAGGRVNTDFDFAADFDLWRNFASFEDLYLATVPLGGFRVHGQQKTALHLNQYYAEVDNSLSDDKLVLWLGKIVKSKHGRRILRVFNKMRRTDKVIFYNIELNQWEVTTWEISR